MQPSNIFTDHEMEPIQKIENFSSSVVKLLKLTTCLEISSEQQCREALKIAAEAKSFHRQIEDIRKRSIEPSRRTIAIINDAAKHLTTQLDELGEAIKVKLSIWQKKLEEDAKEAKERVSQLSKELGIDIYTPEAPKTLSNEYAVASTKYKWGWSVVDESLVPKEYLMPDPEKIERAVKAGVREIAGVSISEISSMTIRRR